MCRWFAYISPTEECLLEDVLITPAHGLTKQVHDHYLPKLISHEPGKETTEAEISLRNRLNNVDGFGVAWYSSVRSDFVSDSEGPWPCVCKNDRPVNNDANFLNLCANISTKALFAHVRAASASAVTSVNSHPFIFGRHTIMHNGVVSDFGLIRRKLLGVIDQDTCDNIHGTTDSEHLAALYMTYLTSSAGRSSWKKVYTGAEMTRALARTFNTIITLQVEMLGPQATPSSLNVCCSDGESMIAVRYRNHTTQQPPSLYYSREAGVTLNRKYPGHPNGKKNENAYRSLKDHGIHVIVASEPTTYDESEWTLMEKNHGIVVDREGVLSTWAVPTVHETSVAA